VTVRFSINPTAVTFANSDCTLGGGESGTGLFNSATTDVNDASSTKNACVPPPAAPVHTKTVSSNPTAIGNGVYEMKYTINVTNAGAGAGTYDLDDALHFGGAITIKTATVANTAPGSIVTKPGWNGVASTSIVTAQPIAAGAAGDPTIHTYVVTVRFTVDPIKITFANSDCTLTAGETGTGLFNTATVGRNDVDADKNACVPTPASPLHTKAVTADPKPIGDGVFEVQYTITVTNPGAGAGVYDLDDALQFGGAITVEDANVENTLPGSIATSPTWDGISDITVVDGAPIDAAANATTPTVHTYVVTVHYSIDAAKVTFANSDCVMDAGETGTGLFNTATTDVNDVDIAEDACAVPPAAPVHTKSVSSDPKPIGGGVYEVGYTITVSNPGAGAGVYDLDDSLQFGAAVTVKSATVTNVLPGSIVTNPAWNGLVVTNIATSVPIDAAVDAATPAVHTYVVTVQFTVDAKAVTFANSDCTMDAGETGTGLFNTATTGVNDVDIAESACAPTPGGPVVTKKVTSGPKALGDGDYEIKYTLTVTNAGAGVGTYDLRDEIKFGTGLTVVGQPVVTNTAPGGIVTNPGWDGRSDTLLVSGQPIAAGSAGAPTVHTYDVTIIGHVPPEITAAAADCSVAEGETGSGFMNSATVSSNGVDLDAQDCVRASAMNPRKDLVDVADLGNGRYTLTYQLTVPYVGPDTTYNLADQFHFSPAVTVESINTTTNPAGIGLNPAFNGVSDTHLADLVPISDGQIHGYTMAITVSVASGTATPADSDCALTGGESGTGFFNEMLVNSDGQTYTDDACAALSPAVSPPAPVEIPETR